MNRLASLRVYVTEKIHADGMRRLAREPLRVDVGSETLPIAEIRRQLAGADVILSKTDPLPIDAQTMACAPRLSLVARHGSGYNNVDVASATRMGILVTNTPGVNAVTIAEYTVGLMFAAARRLCFAARMAALGDPDRIALSGMELCGKTFGIIGVGHIGRTVVERVHALGMRVLAHHPRPSARGLGRLPLELVDLDTLLSQSDVVSLHVPLNEETRGLIGARELALMKASAILLNLSRGGVVDEDALYQALRSDALFAAATDVLVNEPVTTDEPLLSLDNCLVLPHIASVTHEAQRAVALATVDEILRLARGELPGNVVNPAALRHPRWRSFQDTPCNTERQNRAGIGR
ncbi:MAG: hydroxyacid dehydrogenase [Gaiellaceae bacterium]